jgi:hypothetical protein
MSAGRRGTVGLGVACAILVAGCDSGGGGNTTGTGTGTGATTAESVPAPGDLEAAPRGVSVQLRWTAPTGGSVQGYGIYRDGELLQGIPATTTEFMDEEVRLDRTYTYEVRARAGGAVSEPVSAEVEVPVPPLKTARVVGDFAVTTRTVSLSGYSNYEKPTFGWHFTPRCRTGACNVGWRDLGRERIHAKLERKGGVYEGNYSGPFLSECNGTPTTSSVVISLRVAQARPRVGHWRATKLVGTLSNSEVAQLGCVASGAKLEVTAKLTSAG